MAFNYQNGDRPLDGYTIQYALGRGGFGEVYFAVSDSGREVALKAVQNYEDVELRGISHCMNLKSPHLVMIFDVRRAENGTPWVIMEYVSGSSLRDILDESPTGLDTDQTRFFMRELCKGLSYLHEAGVVHRDMKPHNVFFEDGIVKIGDYSLSKVITASHRSGNTMTVGSVHYMAPEISMGRYDKTVDIYALGCMLYEMLTGEPPFVGESMGEVLMKHLSQEPDLSKVPSPFADAVGRALQRDPADRFQTAQEFADAIREPVETPMDSFHPATLSLVGQKAREARRVASVQGPANSISVEPPRRPNIPEPIRPADPSPTFDSTAPTVAGDTQDLPHRHPPRPVRAISKWQMLGLRYTASQPFWQGPDALHFGWRFALVVLTAIIGTVLLAMLTPSISQAAVVSRGGMVVMISLAVFLVTLMQPKLRSAWLSRTVFGVGAWVVAVCLDSVRLLNCPNDFEAITLGLVAGAVIPDWRCLIAADRPKRIMIGATWMVGVVATVAALIAGVEMHSATCISGTLMLAAFTTQLAAPLRLQDRTSAGGATVANKVSSVMGISPLAIVCELVVLACGLAVVCFMNIGDGDLIPVILTAAGLGYMALRVRLTMPRQSGKTLETAIPAGVISRPLILEFLVAACSAATIGFMVMDHSDFVAGAVIFGALTLFFLRIRWATVRIAKWQERTLKHYRLDPVACVCELALITSVCTCLGILPWLPFDDDLTVGFVVAVVAGVLALRVRLTRQLIDEVAI